MIQTPESKLPRESLTRLASPPASPDMLLLMQGLPMHSGALSLRDTPGDAKDLQDPPAGAIVYRNPSGNTAMMRHAGQDRRIRS